MHRLSKLILELIEKVQRILVSNYYKSSLKYDLTRIILEFILVF